MKITPDKFRRMAVKFSGVCESTHMGHPDFRVGGRIFATLGAPDENWGMVKLTPDQQKSFIREAPGVFAPCSGAWGRAGATSVHLPSVTADKLKPALDAAWRNVSAKLKSAGGSRRC